MNKIEPGFYKHRSGRLYQVLFVARNSTDCDQHMVVYIQLQDGYFLAGQEWTAPLAYFMKPGRFEPIDILDIPPGTCWPKPNTSSDWIPWYGGDNPAPDNQVIALLRNGCMRGPRESERFIWDRIDCGSDVIAYIVIGES